jgi:alpha-tubulin suppressor-like RCC1 family protein
MGQLNVPAGTYARVAVGSSHVCAVRTDGSLACWGDNTYGQLASPH